jgi:hypothetical protein
LARSAERLICARSGRGIDYGRVADAFAAVRYSWTAAAAFGTPPQSWYKARAALDDRL